VECSVADRYTSRIALVLEEQVDAVEDVVAAAVGAGDVDRGTPVRNQGREAMEVNWGGRMQRAVVRRIEDAGRHLLRVEAYVGEGGPKEGLRRQAQLLQGLARHVGGVLGVVDLDARVDHDVAWLNRVAVAGIAPRELIAHEIDGVGTWWVHTHGAARFDVPDLELYGLTAGQTEAASAALRHVHDQLLEQGLKAALTLPSGEDAYLVPVLQAWQHCELEWPGVGRAGKDRGPGLDGPRATLSLLHRPRFGKYRVDLEGVLEALG
jgi:hypothetical protein